VRQLTGDAVARACFGSAAATPPGELVSLDDPTGQHRTIRFKPLPDHLQAELVEAAERAQIRAGEGSVKHVEVFLLGGVRTPIIGRPRPLPRDRRAHRYTLNPEEPVKRHDDDIAVSSEVTEVDFVKTFEAALHDGAPQ